MKIEKSFTVECTCCGHCTILRFEHWVGREYWIGIFRHYPKYKGRIKKAFNVLLGKEIDICDLTVSEEDMRKISDVTKELLNERRE